MNKAFSLTEMALIVVVAMLLSALVAKLTIYEELEAKCRLGGTFVLNSTLYHCTSVQKGQ